MNDEKALKILRERRQTEKEALLQNRKRVRNRKLIKYLSNDEFVWLTISIISMIAFIAINIIYYKKFLITIPAFIFFPALYAASLNELEKVGETEQYKAMIFTFPMFFTVGAPLYFSVKILFGKKSYEEDNEDINFFQFLLFGIGVSFLFSAVMLLLASTY